MEKIFATGHMNQTERLLNAAADHIAATLEQPSDMRAWEQLLIYCPRTGAKQMIEAIAALAKRFWNIHPREIQDLGITREQFYEREMKNLFATQAARIEQLEAALRTVEQKLIALDAKWALEGGPFDGEWMSDVLAALTPEQDK